VQSAARGMTLCDPAFHFKPRLMPIDSKRYPQNWIEIAKRAKDAAGWRCQHCQRLCLRPAEKQPDLCRSEWTKATLSVPERQLHTRRQPTRKSNCSVYALSFSPARSNQTLKCLTRATVALGEQMWGLSRSPLSLLDYAPDVGI
jgi:hypothetical protein